MRSQDVAQHQQKRRSSRSTVPFLALLAALGTVVVLIRRGYIHYDQRAFNKRILNPLMMRFAGRFALPQAIIYHNGRKSGTAYATPIVVEPITGGFIIPLPYGADVDWCRNVVAAGHCAIRWHGATYAATAPVVLDVQAIATMVSSLRQRLFRMIGVRQVLQVRLSPAPATPIATGW